MHTFITLTVATLSALTAAVPHARNHFSFHHAREVAPIVRKVAPIAGRSVPGTFELSPIGQCGGTSGFQCAEGFCCSKWGYCGQTAEYCGAGATGSNMTSAAGPSGTPQGPPSYSSPSPSGTAAVPSAAPSAAPSPSASSPPPSTGSGTWTYKTFTGNGSPSAGWPSQDSWVDFETAFQSSVPNMKASCAQWDQTADSDSEISDMKSAITSVASSAGVDPRFVLAIIMQESNGCVRVQTTDNGVRNPGLMQSHNGSGTCWDNGVGTNPCPASEITTMIQNGVEGTPSGDGLKQCLGQSSATGSEAYYQAAVIYNSGNLPANLDDNTATPCYASDVANRLMGWFEGTSTCTF